MTVGQVEFATLKEGLERSSTGRLELNGQEMILLPRHFFRYILREVLAHAGPEAFAKIFSTAGHDGALTFCRRFREFHDCSPREAVLGYFREMSLRGWGEFQVVSLDAEAGQAELLLSGSAIVAEGELPSGHLIWAHSLVGALRFCRECLQLETELVPRLDETADGCRITLEAPHV